ncbi:class I SAM-dependent methyltransferase, partial [Vibrio owensii]|uniref:class I SAM-dependent methyltransferase n=1 Tax=Vibrio owensii TaxID=696485 RepID=UPI003AADBD57
MKSSTYVKSYYQNGLVQHDAALELVELLPISSSYVLDVGCGSGKVSELFYRRTCPLEMVAIDKSFEMIKEAILLHESTKINYKNHDIENVFFKQKFDIIISNSSLQWFKNIKTSLSNIHAHLSDNGRFYIQAPFRKNWCPEITLMVDEFFDEQYPELINHFSFPCLHLDTLDEYVDLF